VFLRASPIGPIMDSILNYRTLTTKAYFNGDSILKKISNDYMVDSSGPKYSISYNRALSSFYILFLSFYLLNNMIYFLIL
jgi:hypothetical protein